MAGANIQTRAVPSGRAERTIAALGAEAADGYTHAPQRASIDMRTVERVEHAVLAYQSNQVARRAIDRGIEEHRCGAKVRVEAILARRHRPARDGAEIAGAQRDDRIARDQRQGAVCGVAG